MKCRIMYLTGFTKPGCAMVLMSVATIKDILQHNHSQVRSRETGEALNQRGRSFYIWPESLEDYNLINSIFVNWIMTVVTELIKQQLMSNVIPGMQGNQSY